MSESSKSPEQVEEEARERAHEAADAVFCVNDSDLPKPREGVLPLIRLHSVINALSRATAWRVASEMLDIYRQHSWVTDNPDIEPALVEAVERFRKEVDEK